MTEKAVATGRARPVARSLHALLALTTLVIGSYLMWFVFGRKEVGFVGLIAIGSLLVAAHQAARCFGRRLPIVRGRNDGYDGPSLSWTGCDSSGDGGSCGGDGGGD